jgi:hypothetical protein
MGAYLHTEPLLNQEHPRLQRVGCHLGERLGVDELLLELHCDFGPVRDAQLSIADDEALLAPVADDAVAAHQLHSSEVADLRHRVLRRAVLGEGAEAKVHDEGLGVVTICCPHLEVMCLHLPWARVFGASCTLQELNQVRDVMLTALRWVGHDFRGCKGGVGQLALL